MTTEYGALTYRAETTPARATARWAVELRRFVAGALFAAALTAIGAVVATFTVLAFVLAAPLIAGAIACTAASRRRTIERRALA